MRAIETALLTGQRKVIVSGIEIDLKPLKRDTQRAKEREARRRANDLMKTLNSLNN